MAKYIGKRLLYMAFTLLVIIVLTFTLMKILPGSPFDAERFEKLTPDQQATTLARYGLDKPIYEQFFIYLGNILKGDLGTSFYYTNMPVTTVIASRLGPSMLIGAQAIILGLTIGLILGIVAACRHNGVIDSISMVIASYSKFSEALMPNHPEQVSKLQRSVVNLLPNHDFELSGYWSNVCYYNGQATFTYDTTEKYMGTRSMKVNKTNNEGNACLFMNFNKLEVGKTYTLSAYIKGTGTTYCYATVSQGAWYDSEKVTPRDDQWTRIFTTFTATKTDATLYFITMGGPGTIWIDCAQLEEGTVPNRYNLIRNSDFSQNDSGVPTFWTANGVNTSEDAIVTDADALHPTFLTNNRMRLYGDPQTNKGIYQDLPLSGSQGDVYVAGGWTKGFSRPIGDDKRHFGIRVAFKNGSGAYENGEILNWNEEWTDWQYVSGAVIAPCAYTGIRFNVDYEKNVNYADFDGMTLYKEEFGNTFTYDDDGNVTAVKDLVGQKAKAQYDDYNNLISYVQPGRPDTVKTTISYGSSDAEKKKRLPLSVDSPTGIRTANTYDANGNLVRSYVIDSMDGTCMMDSHQSYTADGNHVATKTDARGKVVTYETDLAKDTLTKVTDPNGQSVNYTYDSRMRVIETNATADGKNYKNTYTYEKDRLKTVAHNTTSDTPDVTYAFDYDEFGNPKTVKVGNQVLSTNVYTDTGDRTLMRVEYGNGGKVNYTRDDFRRVTGISYDNATKPRFTYGYGANGQAAYVRDSELNRTVWTEYDTSERPTRVHVLEGATSSSVGTPKYVNEVKYDQFGNVEKIVERVNNQEGTQITYYYYDDENRVTEIICDEGDRTIGYTYDVIGRIATRTANGWKTSYPTTYQYLAPENGDSIQTTPLVQSITQNGQNFSYTYDNVGNITSVTRNGLTTTYVYDKLGQLIRENDPHANKTTVYNYDRGGNILSCVEYAYTTGTLGTATQTTAYTYGDSNWKDKVTAIGGKTITYDAIGNPLTYDGWTFTWKAGRMLASMVKSGTNAQFTYDHNGLRIKKVVNGVTTNYTLNGKNVVHMTQGSHDLHFFYDAQGKPGMVTYNDVDYFYVYNLQGDVVALIDADGTQVVEYVYNAWGNPISKTGSLAATIGTLNPFRYRGYVYDEETGLYYLRSRYYNPVWKRFINADVSLGNADELFAHNVYAYCINSPLVLTDQDGDVWMMGAYAPYYGYYHQEVQKWIVENNANIDMEVLTSTGRMDLYNRKTYEVYEVKPDTPEHISAGIVQLQRYISGNKKAVLGKTKLILPPIGALHYDYPNTMVDVVVKQKGAMITYSLIVRRKNRQFSTMTAREREKEKEVRSSLGLAMLVLASIASILSPGIQDDVLFIPALLNAI